MAMENALAVASASQVESDLALARLVVELLSDCTDFDERTIDARIEHALQALGELVGADRAYVFLLRRDGRTVDNTHEWCAPGIASQTARLQAVAMDEAFPWFARHMREHRALHVPRVAALPPEAALEKSEFEAESIRSLIVVPMPRADTLYGFLGFDSVRHERIWTDSEIALLRIVGRILLNILERAKVERALKASEERFRSLVEHTSDWVWEVDPSGTYTYVSPRSVELLGMEAQSLLGRTAFDLMPAAEAERVRPLFESRVRRGLPIERLENRLRRADGREIVVETSAVPIFDEAGAIVAYRGIDRDITERKRAEQERREFDQRLREAQRLESLGLLAGGIAHDFNNLLTPILGQASLASLMADAGEDVREPLQIIQLAATRAADLTRELLAYTGRAPLRRESINVSQLVQQMIALLNVSISKQCTLHLSLARDIPDVLADPAQLRQILMNLVLNASEASLKKGGGTIDIATGTLPAESLQLSRSFFAEPQPRERVVFLEVRDEGIGMDAAVCEQAFEPFFSTKATGRGLGLAAVLGIVRGHGGGIEVHSAPGLGARFRIVLPAAAPASRTPAVDALSHTAGLRGSVLVVDDEEMVRRAASAILQSRGLHVIEAADGEEALRRLEEAPGIIRMVLLDMTMPGLGGDEVLARMRRTHPQIPVVVQSGYAAEETAERLRANPPDGVLQKPWTADQLLAALSEALRRAPS